MAKLPVIKRLNREDFKDAPPWIDRLLYSINLFFEAVYYALDKQLTTVDNVVSQRETFRIKAGASASANTYSFSLKMSSTPKMLIVGNCFEVGGTFVPIASAVFVEWSYENGIVNIQAVTGLTSGRTYQFEILLLP